MLHIDVLAHGTRNKLGILILHWFCTSDHDSCSILQWSSGNEKENMPLFPVVPSSAGQTVYVLATLSVLCIVIVCRLERIPFCWLTQSCAHDIKHGFTDDGKDTTSKMVN